MRLRPNPSVTVIVRLALLLVLTFSVWVVASAGEVVRSHAELRAFAREHPCPANGLPNYPCPGYVVDHLWPLCAGGPDRRENMQWQTIVDGKTKDRLEIAACRKLKCKVSP